MIKEACVESLKEALLAEEKGANRIELCADLANDGLTPTFGLMKRTVAALKIPVMVMARPRAGDFVYSDVELVQMKVAINYAKEAGAAGIVLGLLTKENQIDVEHTKMLVEYAQPLEVTFHKAIDEMDDPVEGVHVLKTIPNIKRILSSGGKATALEGQEVIRKMIAEADGKITILVAGKVTNENVIEIQQITGTTELHGRKIVGDLTS
ncbi:copper homeostasis protein CutC [Draconibacterium sediminis]|uniref:copper homeostasis protein CutC n=1 Tax=Draconibacterium sediminis TaxID=1544798 RepID=UPI0026F1B860|nr:copper homeostasis protein CutC [Draconibacterium sediminis]